MNKIIDRILKFTKTDDRGSKEINAILKEYLLVLNDEDLRIVYETITKNPILLDLENILCNLSTLIYNVDSLCSTETCDNCIKLIYYDIKSRII